MHEKAPAVVAWVKRMNSDNPALQSNNLLDNDEIPNTLLPILIRMAKEQLPVLVDTDKQLAQWRQQNPNQPEIKRFIGKHDFTVEGVTNQRVILPYALWMFQRAIVHYQKSTHQQELDQLLKTIGFGDTLKIGLKNTLTRTHNALCFSP